MTLIYFPLNICGNVSPYLLCLFPWNIRTIERRSILKSRSTKQITRAKEQLRTDGSTFTERSNPNMEINQNRSDLQMTIGLLADPQSKLRRVRTSKKDSSTFTESKEKKRWAVRCRNNRNMEINQRRSEVQMTIGLLSKNKATKYSQRGVNTEKEGVQSGAVCRC
jgi:hypothetical protein